MALSHPTPAQMGWYIFLYYNITIKHIWLEQTFSRISLRNGNITQFYVNIVISGRPRRLRAPFCLLLIIPTSRKV